MIKSVKQNCPGTRKGTFSPRTLVPTVGHLVNKLNMEDTKPNISHVNKIDTYQLTNLRFLNNEGPTSVLQVPTMFPKMV